MTQTMRQQGLLVWRDPTVGGALFDSNVSERLSSSPEELLVTLLFFVVQ